MFPAISRQRRFAQHWACAVLGAWLLAGCGSVPDVPGIDLRPPSLIEPAAENTADAAPAEPKAPASKTPVPRDQRNVWLAISGPIFDWRAEGWVGQRDAATTTRPSESTAASPEPVAPAAVAAANDARPVVVTLKPSLALDGAPPPAVAPDAPPPAWQTAPGPIFNWAAGSGATAPPTTEPETPTAWQLRERQMRGLPEWRLNGRVAISSPQDSWSAVLRWDQRGDAFHVRLSNPLGQGLLDLRGVPGEVLLRTAEGEIYRAPDAQTLLRDVAGMNLPVSGLRYWLLAVTDPAAAKADVKLDADSLPVSVEQAGWRIEYDRYRDTDGLRLPDRLTFQGSELDGRLIVTQWDLRGS